MYFNGRLSKATATELSGVVIASIPIRTHSIVIKLQVSSFEMVENLNLDYVTPKTCGFLSSESP